MQAPGLYIHIPFCRSKCPYCGFYSIAATSLIPRWVEAFKKEAALYQERFPVFNSLYLGGGTPTFLEISTLSAMVGHIFDSFDFAPDSEITIEANPSDLTREKIEALKDLTFNRVSLGVQSFDDRILAFLGRTHKAKEAEKALNALRDCGFENIGMDLIYGFQGLSHNKWIDILKKAVTFQPEHLSCYELTFEKRTPFQNLKNRGEIRPLREREACAFFVETSEFLEDNGYIHYEVSNFARDEDRYARHNSKYWNHVPYLGLGPSAHSFIGSKRWWNVRSVRQYSEALERGQAPVLEAEDLSEDQLRIEAISLGLRCAQGFDLKHLSDDPGLYERIAGLEDLGMLKLGKGRVIPTKRGLLASDYLALCCAD
jgi:oxygen-independent coproporphyrinogen-3 oxidase